MILLDKIDFPFENILLHNKTGKSEKFLKSLKKKPVAHISLLKAKSLKKTENLENRIAFFKRQGIDEKNVISATQVHSKRVLFFDTAQSYHYTTKADGIITRNKDLVPAVLVSDCMPIFLFDLKSESFAVLHSGWKGSGISLEAINLLSEQFDSSVEDLYFILGPHIRSCCYNVDAERAKYFRAIDKASIKLSIKKLLAFNRYHYKLSLARANISLLKKAGVPRENIYDVELCTYCTKMKELKRRLFLPASEAGKDFAFGSNRRENPKGIGQFTSMLAFITWE